MATVSCQKGAIMVFQEMVQKEVKVLEDGTIVSNMSDADKKAINASRSAATATVADTGEGLVSSVSISAALNARLEGNSVSESSSNIKSDQIHMKDHKLVVHVFPCAVAKATNYVTGFLEDVTVMKIYTPLRLKLNDIESDLNDTIREDYVSPFKKKADAIDPNSKLIVKRTTMKDTILSMTAFPEDLRYYSEFDNVLALCNKLKILMVYEFLESVKGSSEDMLIAAYRNINTSKLEDIFNSIYTSFFGRVNSSDSVQVDQYNDALKDFNEAKSLIGSTFLSNSTLSFGLYTRKLTISPSVVWENVKKLGKVKKNRAGSYFVSSNMDSGIGAVPITGDILSKHIDQILAITDYCMALLESEARVENGFKPLELPELPKIEFPKFDVKYRDILGLTKEQEDGIKAALETKAKELANQVCQRFDNNNHNMTTDLIRDLMSRRRGE